MFRTAQLTTILLAALAAPAAAQSCCNLTMSGTGHYGTMMVFSLTGGSPHAPAMLAFSGYQGQASFNFGQMGMLQLGLSEPLVLAFMGETDGNGDAQMGMQVPHHMMHVMHMFGQGFTTMMQMQGHHGHQHPYLMFCTSNVMGFGVGGHGH